VSASSLLRLVPAAPQALRDFLDDRYGPAAPPIRSEIFGLQRFAEHGRSLGLTHRAALARIRAATFFPRLRDNIRVLREAHRYIGLQASTGYDISPAAEWLLDNFHLIEAQLKEIHEGLPRSYFRKLPMLIDEPLAGLPRIYGVAWAFVAHTDGAFDEVLLMQFLHAYQESRELDLAEMWALPTVLRVVLIENLRRLAERVAANKAAREVANLCCDRIDACSVASLEAMQAQLDRRGAGRMFLAQLGHRLRDGVATGGGATEQHAWLQKALPDLATVQAQQIADQAADNLSVSNAVTSLRAIGDADWTDIVARSSALMRLMLTSPLFAAESASTRDQTLHDIEHLARRSARGELAVAQILLERMRDGDGAAAVASHWLRGPGRRALTRTLGLDERAARAWRPWARHLALPAYLGVLLFGTFGLVAWVLSRATATADGSGLAAGWIAAAALLMLFPVSEALVAVINRLVSESARPRALPRLALAGGIPPEHRVMVAIPAMLTNLHAPRTLAHRLHLHYLANPERQAQFALLTDWADAHTPELDTDAALLAEAVREIEALNAAHPHGDGPPRFIVLHRARHFSASEQRWIGWERKRGKLEQLVTALATGVQAGFLDLGPASRIGADTRYVVTLDSDTHLPPGALRELVGLAAHPHNRPVLDAQGRRVVRGHAILQPRIVTPLPAPGERTPFHWLFAGQCGIDPYSAASSEVYQDLFDAGSFSGKGLLDVQAMHAVLSGRLPDGLVLSHDLLEGAIARCAAVTDVRLIEEAPFHADVALWRVHRWMRGDWQLLPILLRPWRYRLRAIDRWKMFDNLRRSLVAPTSLALLLLALTLGVPSPGAALLMVLAAFAAGPLIGAVAGFAPSRDDIAKRHFYRQAAIDLLRALCGGLWHLALALQNALMAVDAIARAVYRMAVSHRHLLQWTTAAALQASVKPGVMATLRRHWSLPVVALLLFVAVLAAATPYPATAAALCALWAASPLWTWWVSRPWQGEAALAVVDRAYLEGIARDTWRFFERCVGPEDHHLPPDNLQTLPQDMVAHRTSPTNIGLYLLSVACARAFGWIGTPELLVRLEATLATLSGLQRHRGHFLNWYDTRTLAPLLPMYVSTVDSGNLAGHLLAVAQACRELARAPPDADTATRLQHAAHECERLAWAADFAFLYHRKRHLFHIGYRVAEQELDAGFYDLLASESRLTSLLAIAKADVPVSHWAALGRPFFAVGARAGLRSWSGSMFEYLMPSLVFDEPRDSVLHDACRAALHEHIAYAKARGVPWGISESAYAGRDHTLAYQYAPQGVPRLALRRTPPEELVVAPYATALAAQIAPHGACVNFAALQGRAARTELGFIEALDFTPARQTERADCVPVHTHMSHHQGMTIVALANVLLGGVARRWGMANPHIEAVASLLHERAPREVSSLYTPPSGAPPQAQQRRTPGLLRPVLPGGALPPTHVLGNGRYGVTLRANGAGTSRWGDSGINRSRDDALRDGHGSFFWLRWDRQSQPVSITQHPAPDPAAHYTSLFHADRVCFDATWPELQAHTTVWVSPEDDVEFRRVELRNLGDRAIDIELLSAFEISLAEARADEAHPAFGNLFVRAAWRSAQQALVFERKPRLATERSLHVAHFLADGDPQVVGVRVQTDRQRWLGRNHDPNQPLAAFDALPDPTIDARNDAGDCVLDTGLDPVCAMAVQLRIAPWSKAELTFATAASDNGGVLSAVIDKYRQPSHVQRASLMSATLSGIRLRALGISAENFAAIQSLTTALVLAITRPLPPPAGDALPARACDRRLLWRFGISGDRPILLVAAGVTQGRGLLRTLAQALRLWAWGGIACDLVVVNSEVASYQMALQREIATLREQHGIDGRGDAGPHGPPCTGLHLLRADELSSAELDTLQGLARVRVAADGRPLVHHVQEWCELHEQAFESRHDTSTAMVGVAPIATGVAAAPVGSFDPITGAFSFDVGTERRPARPWVNVLANADFGALLSEAGGGYTWARNSRLNQLTAWSNDPVADPPGEWFVLQDRRTRKAWSVTPSAWGALAVSARGSATYRVTHGQGSSVVRHRRGDAEISATWCVDSDRAVKQVRLQITNHGTRTLHWRAIGIVEWIMGAQRSDRATVHTAMHRQRLPGHKLTALLCTQRERSAGFGEGTAFLAIAAGPNDISEDWTCDRRECFDARGSLVLPDHYGQRSGSGLDPCAALSIDLTVAPGEEIEQVFLIGYADNPAAACQLAVEAAASPARARSERVAQHWDRLLGATAVQTPDPLFDALVNRWLLYQTVACRLWAKAGFYQAGGATGFRDQLQDAMALTWAAPAMLRDQIVLAASRQFPQGDVQHWWHAPGGAGVRTHFSDDLLWLPHACVRYLRATGDAAVLDERVPFIEGPPIPDGAEDMYDTPTPSTEDATVYEHCARAIDRSLRVGAHGLPLMGSGDWNDGMNRVGIEGRGESVWLGWFLCRLVADFAPLAHSRRDGARARRWEQAAQGWIEALKGPAWDGQWFKRAFFDDGSALGSHANPEARIDLIAQAWAVLSGVAPVALQRIALAAAEAHLVDREAGLIRLLDPPLARAEPPAGYIQAYPPGVRENGSQYSHGGVWALMAQAEYAVSHAPAGDNGNTAYRYFTYLSPAHRALHATHGAAYAVEPYVMAGDVYSQPPYVGRGGWSWYTGAAGWMHRAAIESIFGLRLGANVLSFAPCLPSHWPRAELVLRRDGRTMRFILLRQSSADARSEVASIHGAVLLNPGQALAWPGLPPHSCFVVPLLPDVHALASSALAAHALPF